MAMGKEKSSKNVTFVKGGTTKQAGKQMKTGTQVPGQTAQMGRGSGMFAKGGPSGKVGKQGKSVPAKPGVSASN
jgi:hypothetical protein